MIHTLLLEVSACGDEACIAAVCKLISLGEQSLRLFIVKEHASTTAVRHGQNQHWHCRQSTRKCPEQHICTYLLNRLINL